MTKTIRFNKMFFIYEGKIREEFPTKVTYDVDDTGSGYPTSYLFKIGKPIIPILLKDNLVFSSREALINSL